MAFRLDQYQAFVEGYLKHPDQGLKACDKKLKREPNNTLYLLAQCQFQWRLQQYDDALKNCLALKTATTDTLDPSLLAQIQGIVAQCQHALQIFNHVAGPQVAALWKDALDKANGQQSWPVRNAMFRAAWRDEYWDLIQLLFARLQKEFPQNPRYHFAWIAMSQIQADAMDPDDKMAQSLRLLALRSLKAAVDNALNDKDSPRRVLDSHHLRLVTQIYRRQGQYDDLLSILQNDKIGCASDVGKGDIEFTRCEIELFKDRKMFDRVFELCWSSLNRLAAAKKSDEPSSVDALSGANDWYTWKNLLEAAAASNDESINGRALNLIERFLQLEPKNRNAGRAYLTYKAEKRAELLGACIRFFDAHCTSRSCFGDLKDFLPRISHREEGEFIRHIDDAAKAHAPTATEDSSDDEKKEALDWVAINVNALKFEYFLCVSKVPLPTKESLENFASDSLHMYKLSLAFDRECGDEACILAVMALVKLHHFARDFDLDDDVSEQRPSIAGKAHEVLSPKCYLVQAVCLLQFLKSNSPHNYSAQLLSLLIHQMLGLTTLADIDYHSLGVKEVAHDTLSHLFCTRISVTHPHDSQVKQLAHDMPSDVLGKALQWYDAAAERSVDFMGGRLDTVPFDKISEFAEFKCRIDTSFTRALLVLEGRRIVRVAEAAAPLEPLPPDFRAWTSDNRDFDTIPNFEYPRADPFSTYVLTKPKPMLYWLARHTVNDIALTLLTGKPPFPAHLLATLAAQRAYLDANAADQTYQLTPGEQVVARGWDLLAQLAAHAAVGPDSPLAARDPARAVERLRHHVVDSAFAPPPLAADADEPAAAGGADDGGGGPRAVEALLPSADALGDAFLRAELLLAAQAAADALAKTSTAAGAKGAAVPRQALIDLRSAAREARADVGEFARRWGAELRGRGVRDVVAMLGRGGVGEDVLGLLEGWDGVDGVVREIVASAVDAVEGLVKVGTVR